MFYDPTGEEQAGCLVSFPEEPYCFKHHLYENGNITQNVKKNETILTIRLEENVLGNWTCFYNGDGERVEVTSKPVAVDLATLNITSNQSLPFLSETVVKVICTAEMSQNGGEIKWDCLHGDVIQEKIDNCTTYTSILALKVTSLDHGKLCTCVARTHFSEKAAVLNIDVKELPTLELQDHIICNESSQISITCVVHGYPSWYKFETWIHTYKNTFLRYMKGTDEGNISTIHIQSCRLEDMGNYTCRLYFAKVKDKPIIKSAFVRVRGSPIIVGTHKDMQKNFTLSAVYLSFPPPYTPRWYTADALISNSSKFIQHTSSQLLILHLYGKQVALHGYVANISVTNDRQYLDSIALVLQNEYGNDSFNFLFPKGQHTFQVRLLLLILVVISVVIITFVVTTRLARKMYRKHMQGTVSRTRRIYFGAPESNTPRMYDRVTSDYDEIDENNPYIDAVLSVDEQDKDLPDDENSIHYIDIN